jgi:hypothetical protein
VANRAQTSHGGDGSSRLAIGIVAVGLVIIVSVLTWMSALRRPFLDDDWSYLNVVQQPGWWHSSTVWNPKNGLYRPVLFLWFGVLHSLFGLHPFAYHLATLAVVLLVGFLVWRIAIAVGLNRGALVAGAVVVLHAAVGYPLSWTAAASSPTSIAFALGAILVLLSRPVTIRRAVVAALLLGFGLLTREVVIVAPAVVVVLAWARPGGNPKEAFLRSLPLWIADIGYFALRAVSGAGNPPGPYHQQLGTHALSNFTDLIVKASDLEGASPQLRTLALTALILFMLGMLVWSLARHEYVLLAGFVWFVIGTLPVILLVNHSMEAYYVDFGLPGLALAFGAACELAVARLSDRIAIIAGLVILALLGFVGHAVSNIEFTHEYGANTTETQRLLTQVHADYPDGPQGSAVLIVHSTQSDERSVTQEGDLYRVIFHDPSLRVRVVR